MPPQCGRPSWRARSSSMACTAPTCWHVRGPAARRDRHTGHRCIGFEQDDEQAILTFANGARVTADVVVAADGIHSTLAAVRGRAVPSAVFGAGRPSRYRFGGERIAGRPERCATGSAQASISSSFPCAPTSSSTTSASLRRTNRRRESWSAPGDPAALAREFAGWDPMVEAIIAQAKHTFRWGLYDREPLARVDQRSTDPARRRRASRCCPTPARAPTKPSKMALPWRPC